MIARGLIYFATLVACRRRGEDAAVGVWRCDAAAVGCQRRAGLGQVAVGQEGQGARGSAQGHAMEANDRGRCSRNLQRCVVDVIYFLGVKSVNCLFRAKCREYRGLYLKGNCAHSELLEMYRRMFLFAVFDETASGELNELVELAAGL